MKKRFLSVFLLIVCVICLFSCDDSAKASTFSIQFIDVGQGDAALVECDGHYMLIDGGKKAAGDKVYSVLQENGITNLDILAISHLHEDHYGGLIKALTFASNIGITICNEDQINKSNTAIDNEADSEDNINSSAFDELISELGTNGTHITVPSVGTKYELGSATVEVIDTSCENDNDSLILLVTYGETDFLFTGDAEEKQQKTLCQKYQNKYGEDNRLCLLKMPHHGAEVSTTYQLLNVFMPEYVVISVGSGNKYGHPSENTISKLNDLKKSQGLEYYRTDNDGDITVKSNGKTISVTTSR